MKESGFFVVILLANIIQGITGFAGTILAMPFSIMLVGYDTAKPVLNVLGLLSGIYVFAGNRRSVDWKELRRIVLIMAAGIFAGMGIKVLLAGRETLLYQALGIFVIVLAVQGLYQRLAVPGSGGRRGVRTPGTTEDAAGAANEKNGESEEVSKDTGDKEDAREPGVAAGATQEQRLNAQQAGTRRTNVQLHSGGKLQKGLELALLGGAGIVHGIFVSGGPLLIGYLTGRIQDKTVFRATISTVWIILNTIILAGDIRSGLWTSGNLKMLAAAVPFLLGGMFVGGKLYKVMSQNVFMILTYALLFISGISLLCK